MMSNLKPLVGQKAPQLIELRGLFVESGTPYGTRTRVSAVKGRRPRPLDEGRSLSVSRFIWGFETKRKRENAFSRGY